MRWLLAVVLLLILHLNLAEYLLIVVQVVPDVTRVIIVHRGSRSLIESTAGARIMAPALRCNNLLDLLAARKFLH